MTTPEPNRPENIAGATATWRTRLAPAALPVAAVLALVALVAAIVFAGLYGYRWYDDSFNKEPVQTARDDALGGAEQVMLNFLNIDLKDRKAYEARLQTSVLGDARTQLLGSDGLGRLLQADPNSAAVLTAKLARSSVVELNTDDNTAKALVFVVVTASRPDEASTSQTMGFQVQVTKDGSAWKANDIQPLDSVAIDPTAPAAGGSTGTPAPSAAPSSPAAPAPTTGAGN